MSWYHSWHNNYFHPHIHWGTFLLTCFLATSYLLGAINLSYADTTTGLVAHYKFDEGSGTTANDSAGNNTGTLTNGPTWTTGKIGGALSFDGGDDYVITGSDFIGTSPVTISAWIYPETLGENGGGVIVTNNKAIFRLSASVNGRLELFSNGAPTAAGSAAGSFGAASFNNWYHVLVTRDASGVANLYINGVLSGTANQNSGTPTSGTTNVVIGNATTQTFTFDGIMDDLRIYNRVLSASDITELYNLTESVTPYLTPYITPPPPPPPPPSTSGNSIYYVRTDGNNSNTGLTNNSSGAWRTIDWAADHVVAGDTVRVQAGTYAEVISPGVSGTLENPVTLVADGVVNTCRIAITSKNYIRVIGFTLSGTTVGCSGTAVRGLYGGTNTGLEFWNNNFDNSTLDGLVALDASSRCNSCIIMGGQITGVFNNRVALGMVGSDGLVGYIKFDEITYLGVVPAGHRMRFVNLNFSNFHDLGTSHPDFFFIASNNPLGWTNNLVESVFGIGTPNLFHNKFAHSAAQAAGGSWSDNVWRFMVSHDLGSAGLWSLSNISAPEVARFKYYNNSIIYSSLAPGNETAISCGTITLPGETVYIYNQLFYRCWGPTPLSAVSPWNNSPFTAVADYNLAFDPNVTRTFAATWNSQAHELSNVNPQLVDVANDNFTLSASSPARGAGGPLTAAVGSGNNSTNLTVTSGTGSFFIADNSSNLPQYGGALVPGDFITVGSMTSQVVSRSGDTLTLASPISWSNGAPVYFGKSSTVDIGAYPYKSSYTLTGTWNKSGEIVTVTPNDPSLVRFVVVYEDGIPKGVANSSPYRVGGIGNGTVTVKLYSLYASKNPIINAAFSSSYPTPYVTPYLTPATPYVTPPESEISDDEPVDTTYTPEATTPSTELGVNTLTEEAKQALIIQIMLKIIDLLTQLIAKLKSGAAAAVTALSNLF